MKRLIAGALAALLVGSLGSFGSRVATSDPAFPWLPPTPSPVGDATTAKIVYTVGAQDFLIVRT